MRETQKYGTVWKEDELDAIVADYFEMLAADIAGQPYVKSRHSAILMQKIGRSHRSVEFKHQNISAVLERLGLPWIPGYIPKSNYQGAIFGAIDRYLSAHPGVFEIQTGTPKHISSVSSVFVPPPVPQQDAVEKMPLGLRRLVKKFDPVERDQRNRNLGRAGEIFVLDVERRRLEEAARTDLAQKVRWVAFEDGDGAGYDILSFDHRGLERLIEVKTTNGGARTPFILTRNEIEVSVERPNEWTVYRVHQFARNPLIFCIFPPLESTIRLRPDTWRASF